MRPDILGAGNNTLREHDMKDAKGHGSDPRQAAHTAARREIQMTPNDPHPASEALLRGMGYQGSDIQRLRDLAGASVPIPAHQTGVESVARSLPKLTNVDPSVLRKVAGV